MTLPLDLPAPAGLSDKEWAFLLYESFARGGDDEQIYYVTVPGDPWSKSRPRFARGKTYQPKDDLAAEQALKWRMRAAKARMFPGNVMLVCRFYRSNFQRIDADNLIKHVCDSGNGVLWADDSQVTLVLGEIQYDRENPRTVILVGNHASTLLRGTDEQRPCVHCGLLYTPHPGRGRDQQRFCSPRCSYDARTTVLSDIQCAQCGKTFRPTTKTQTLCSRACRADLLRAKRRAAAAPFSRCTECDKELKQRRGGRCRDCWRKNPRFYAEAGP